MYSSKDIERFYFQYKIEVLPHGMSIEIFCLNNKVPYSLFSKYYKDTRKKVFELQVEGIPVSKHSSIVREQGKFVQDTGVFSCTNNVENYGRYLYD